MDMIKEKAIQILEQKQKEKNSLQNSDEIPQVNTEYHDYTEMAKDAVGVEATKNAVKDDNLVKDVTDRKKAELLNYADAHLKREEAENKKADILLQEANYGVYSGVANYAGIKKPLPQKMQLILFTILSALQTIFLIAFGIPISIINITADGVDSVVKKLGTLTKSAMWIVVVCIMLGAVMVFVYVVKFILIKIGIII